MPEHSVSDSNDLEGSDSPGRVEKEINAELAAGLLARARGKASIEAGAFLRPFLTTEQQDEIQRRFYESHL